MDQKKQHRPQHTEEFLIKHPDLHPRLISMAQSLVCQASQCAQA
jgi:hypothetical protein